MVTKNQGSQLFFYSVEPEVDIHGVEKTIILPRASAQESGDYLLQSVGYLVFTVSEWCQLTRIVIQTGAGSVVLHVTENFLVGAVLNSSANAALMDEILAKAASALEGYFEQFRAVDIKTVEAKIRKGGDGTPG